MTKTQDLGPELSPYDEIRFVESHRPPLEAGDYTLEVSQQVDVPGAPKSPYGKSQEFSVLGERFEIAPDQFHAVFPPPGSRGHYWHVFPHVILERSTMPWERSACDDVKNKNRRPPWLALLLFHDDEVPKPQTKKLGDLKAKGKTGVVKIGDATVSLESAQHDNDGVVLIEVPRKTLAPLVPASLDDFDYRTHVRRVAPLEPRFRLPAAKPSKGDPAPDLAAAFRSLDADKFPAPLRPFLERHGVALAPAKTVTVEAQEKGKRWRITSRWPVARAKGRLEITGSGPKLVLAERVDMVAKVLAAALMPADLKALLAHHGVTLSDNAEIEPDPKNKNRWQIAEAFEIFRTVDPESGKDRLEVHGYGAPKEQAVVIGDRLPKAGARNVAHLVSLEDRCDEAGKLKDQGDKVTLVSLKSWDFFCLDETKTFKGLLEGLNGPPVDKAPSPELFLPPEAFPGAPGSGSRAAFEPYLRAGLVPLRHGLRRGDRTVSWYHGPLVPREPGGTTADQGVVGLPARAADSLVLYDQTLGMFDVSYAAAWELGRLLTLKNRRLALRLFTWKRRHAHALRSERHLADFGFHLPTHDPHHGTEAAPGALPPELQEYFDGLLWLHNVPFSYLVPDERLLPPESLRFFSLDRAWLECLRDGAWSVGRVLGADAARDAEHVARQPPIPPLSGLLLRSEAVAGYPGLQVDAYAEPVPAKDKDTKEVRDDSHLEAATYPKLRPLRRERVGKNVLLCLFAGEARMADVHLKPETLHFGLDLPDNEKQLVKLRKRLKASNGKPPQELLIKELRSADGEQISAPVSKIEVGAAGVVDFPDLAAKIKKQLEGAKKLPEPHLPPGAPRHSGLNPAIFALEMVAGVELVRFVRHASKRA